MIEIGHYNELTILRQTSVGLFLGNDQGDEVHFFELAISQPIYANLKHGSGNGNGGSRINTVEFKGYEKQQNREKIV